MIIANQDKIQIIAILKTSIENILRKKQYSRPTTAQVLYFYNGKILFWILILDSDSGFWILILDSCYKK
jgi:hypothetical protein